MTQLLHQGDWQLNLASARLGSLTLDGANSRLFERACFAGAELDDVRLRGVIAWADFGLTKIRRCSFIGCFLNGTSFRGAIIEDVVVLGSQASGCNFAGAKLVRCTLSDVMLGGSSVDGATLRDVVFEHCDLTDISFGDSTWENVDLVDCTNVDGHIAALDEVNVITRRHGAEGTGASTRMTSGATPRRLSWDASDTAAGRMIARYARASTKFRPPLGYRIETLVRLLSVWLALGWDYWRVRRKWRRAAVQEDPHIFPRNRLLFALKVLVGSYWDSDQEHIAAVVYGPLAKAFEKRYPELLRIELPELIFVDGTRPVVRYVDTRGQRYIVMSIGMEVTTIRLARYCVAWVCPPAVSYMDSPPAEMKPEAIREVLRRDLEQFARDGDGDIAGVGRLQVTGLRHTQADFLAMTFLAFILAHEMAHFLHSIGLVDLHGGTWRDELEADILAAKVIGEEEELDGEAMLIDAVKDMDIPSLRRALRLVQHRIEDNDFDQIDIDRLSDEELERLKTDTSPEVSLFADGTWHASAIAALILIVGSSIGYDSGDGVYQRADIVVRAAFGENVLTRVEQEMATEESVLHLLQDVFRPR